MDGSAQSVPESWKYHHENDFQWEYRKRFLNKNLKEFSNRKKQLISLSMTWANVTFLGCRYPPALMEKVAHMSEGIEVSYKADHPKKKEDCLPNKENGSIRHHKQEESGTVKDTRALQIPQKLKNFNIARRGMIPTKMTEWPRNVDFQVMIEMRM
ncbi:putative NF-kappa-B-repressing factor isoform X2 [Apostichopus japonicus]|uniref:Putative NF-kappa-B-repressing factor isoform X2 n=1 Tax=Stichopus japonicus TaxID=307972 RepID=A0A2G8L8S0_STIJA|nr:putative NF-kappa-B-repressing factor isoform X2 [Apostichopus japonicus]